MRPVSVQLEMYREYCVEHNEKDSKLKVDEHVEYQNAKYFFESIHSKLVWGRLGDEESKKHCTMYIPY